MTGSIEITSRRKRVFASLAGTLLALVPLLGAPSASAVGDGRWSMEILIDGVPADEYAARGRSYVEALQGREYAVRLTNNSPERIAIALSVDGLNSIDAKTTTPATASKWILDPWDSIVIDGWQTSSSTARKFFFTTEESSYGNWLGKTRNLGTISAAVFREKRPDPPRYSRRWWNPFSRDKSAGAPPASGGPEGRLEAQEKGSADAPSAGPERSDSKRQREAEPSDDLAATGIGRELDHEVTRVEFRAESSPATILSVRYEYRDSLVRLGVLPHPYRRPHDPMDRREQASGWSDGYAPDPYRYHRGH
jgi:hypothetical protein